MLIKINELQAVTNVPEEEIVLGLDLRQFNFNPSTGVLSISIVIDLAGDSVPISIAV